MRTNEPLPSVEIALERARTAATAWALRPVAKRLRIIRRGRLLMAQQAALLAASVTSRSIRDTLVSEVLPLLDAMRFLERSAKSLLATKKCRTGRPMWLFGVSAEVQRVPLGVILVIGPGNYPLFLPCIQAIQALVAGNAVCLKPAPGGEAAAAAVLERLLEAGLPDGVMQLLDSTSGPEATQCRFDRVVFTGAAGTGIKVLEATVAQLIPCTMELSGCDATFIMPEADISLAARCIAFGITLNAGATCIAPRRVFVHYSVADAFEQRLLALLRGSASSEPPAAVAQHLAYLLERAVQAGARVVRAIPNYPVVVADARGDMELLQQDVFASWLALVPVPSMSSALVESTSCPYALGASIFGPLAAARQLATQVNAGSVCINDVIVPTADPRLSFGGSGRSGSGRTRGPEGLLEMTKTRSVSTRWGGFRPHLQAARPGDGERLAKLIRLLHGAC